jgi:parallel beta-helix repeat protein
MRKMAVCFVILTVSCSGGGGECTTTITAGADAARIQAALIGARAGHVICFEEGTYMLSEELSLSVSGVTLRGQPDRAKVILDFSQQQAGNANGFQASGANDLVIENLTVRDTRGDALRVTNGRNVTFRNLHVYWSRGPARENGAYGIYPVAYENVLVEDCLVTGASDAGIYVGQSKNAMIRRNTVEKNVTGIEIENTDDAEVTENTATDNVAGILVFNLPNLPRKSGSRTKVHRNTITANNRESFAHGGIVSYVPPGAGMILFANDDAEIHDNTFSGNVSTGVVVVSCSTVEIISDNAVNCADPAYDGFAEKLHIHDNVFSGNGTAPAGFYQLFWVNRPEPLHDILWDGVVDTSKPNPDGALDLCIRNNGAATFARINPSVPGTIGSTDLAPHDCSHPPLAGVDVTW